jgi:hypothetical protein
MERESNTVNSLRRALTRVDAGPEGKNNVFWTSLREVTQFGKFVIFFNSPSIQEPVVYIAGRPHVLRLVDRPLENVE